jgi:serine/threonine-protein kinase RsbT
MTDTKLALAEVPITNSKDVVTARRRGLEMATALGFSTPEATKLAVVISELGRNIILYAQEGTITLAPSVTPKKQFKIIAEDKGPGIPDLDLVLKGGYSTSNGLGVGLSGSKRLVDQFEVQSAVGAGTTVTAVKFLR